jgi:hypothetical protein
MSCLEQVDVWKGYMLLYIDFVSINLANLAYSTSFISASFWTSLFVLFI